MRMPCTEWEYLALAISAYHGIPVEDPYWLPHFESQDWYRPDPSMSTEAIAEEMTRNVVWVESLLTECRGNNTNPVSDQDRAVVIEWFEGYEQGTPLLPEHLFVDGTPATEAELLDFMAQENAYEFTRRTWIHSSSSIGEDAVPERQTRSIGVYPGHPLMSCVWDMCEGYESIHFTIDADGQIIALSVSASG